MNGNPYCIMSWDIEIANVFEVAEGQDLEDFAPFDISVASVGEHGDDEPGIYYTMDQACRPAASMNRATAHDCLCDLAAAQKAGFRIFAWNGLAFDWRWLGHNAGDMELAGRLALTTYDPCFQMLCARGFPVGLAAVAQGMGIERKKLMDGAEAPKLWQAGEHQRVIDYVRGDVTLTNEVVHLLHTFGHLRWVSRTGRRNGQAWPKCLTVRECLRLPPPDTSWMDGPKSRESCYRWIPAHVLAEAGIPAPTATT